MREGKKRKNNFVSKDPINFAWLGGLRNCRESLSWGFPRKSKKSYAAIKFIHVRRFKVPERKKRVGNFFDDF